MAINLELENGLIKKYPTSYRYYYAVGGEPASDIKRKCNTPDDCDHLDCAICAAEHTAKDGKSHFKLYIFISAFWFVIEIFNPGLGLGFGGFFVLFAIYNIWQSGKAAKRAKELIEFRDYGRINEVKAHKL